MDRVSIRQLRNDVSRIVRRAGAGERLIITSNGVAVAEIRPLERTQVEASIEELVEAGLVNPPRSTASPPPAKPVEFSGGQTTEEIFEELREDRV